jgi:hypothetical protein
MAGEMNFAPTMWMEAFEGETFDGNGRNEFRSYNEGGDSAAICVAWGVMKKAGSRRVARACFGVGVSCSRGMGKVD